MKQSLIALGLAALSVVAGSAVSRAAQTPGPLRLVETIALPSVSGRIDHFSADVRGRRLSVSALGNRTVEVVDLAAGKRVRSLPDVQKPQGQCSRVGKVLKTGGQGFVSVVQQMTPHRYGLIANVPRKVGARTGYWNEQHDRLYIGVQAEGTTPARILGFEAEDY